MPNTSLHYFLILSWISLCLTFRGYFSVEQTERVANAALFFAKYSFYTWQILVEGIHVNKELKLLM